MVSLLGTGAYDIHLSVPLILEYEDVLLRQRRMLGLTKRDVTDFLDYVCRVARKHDIYFLWRPFLKDPSDDMVLELAVTAGCDYIVTYNKGDFAGVEAFDLGILDAREFLQTIEAFP